MTFSILVSALGGAILSTKMNDKSTEIKQIYSVQSDSIRKQHDDNLQAVNANINAYKENLQKGGYWAKYATREKLDKAIETRNNLLASAKSDIMGVQTAKNKEVFLNSVEGENFALISAIIVLFLEILSILAYYFQYSYHANCEKEAVNFSVLSPTADCRPIEVVSNNVNNPNQKSELSEIRDLLQSFLNGNNNLQLAGNTISPGSNKVGFSFGCNPTNVSIKEATDCSSELSNNVSNEAYVSNNASKKADCRPFEPKKVGSLCNCENCGTQYKVKTIWQRFCKEECRLEWHGKENGFNLNLFNKKKGGK
jgi:hypothetical protein